MSVGAIKPLMEQMAIDADFRRRVTAATDPQDRLALINAADFDCTVRQVDELMGRLGGEKPAPRE